MRILLIDNNDSFTRNLEHLLVSAIGEAVVHVEPYARLDALAPAEADLVVISPGPGAPSDYPGYERVTAAGRPVLGICLGMQILNALRGGDTGRLEGCVHGKTDVIAWQGEPLTVARYHSLAVTRLGRGLEVLAENDHGVPMALGSRPDRLLGYQFHPESFLTPDGGRFIHDGLDYLGLS